MYARAFLEGRLTEANLDAFRQQARRLSSYPHPRLMPEFWEFPTVSMGLGPLNAIYQARFNRYLRHGAGRHLRLAGVGVHRRRRDGRARGPGRLTVAGRAAGQLTFVPVNCNLQRLDGPVRGNGKIIQEMEALFAGPAGTSSRWSGAGSGTTCSGHGHRAELVAKLNATPDGQLQTLAAEDAAYVREHLFDTKGLAGLIDGLSDAEVIALASTAAATTCASARRLPGRSTTRASRR